MLKGHIKSLVKPAAVLRFLAKRKNGRFTVILAGTGSDVNVSLCEHCNELYYNADMGHVVNVCLFQLTNLTLGFGCTVLFLTFLVVVYSC